jgi:ketosteroid isomerase-like protein
MTNKDISALADEFIDHYNNGRVDEALALCAENLEVTHSNRDVNIKGREAFREILNQFATLLPDKHFENRKYKHVVGNHVIFEHTWTGTATQDIPGFGAKSVSHLACLSFLKQVSAAARARKPLKASARRS